MSQIGKRVWSSSNTDRAGMAGASIVNMKCALSNAWRPLLNYLREQNRFNPARRGLCCSLSRPSTRALPDLALSWMPSLVSRIVSSGKCCSYIDSIETSLVSDKSL